MMLSVYFMFIIVNLMHQAKRIESITTDTKFLSLRNYAIRVSPTERFFFNFFFFLHISFESNLLICGSDIVRCTSMHVVRIIIIFRTNPSTHFRINKKTTSDFKRKKLHISAENMKKPQFEV